MTHRIFAQLRAEFIRQFNELARQKKALQGVS